MPRRVRPASFMGDVDGFNSPPPRLQRYRDFIVIRLTRAATDSRRLSCRPSAPLRQRAIPVIVLVDLARARRDRAVKPVKRHSGDLERLASTHQTVKDRSEWRTLAGTPPAQQCSMFRHVVTLWAKALDRVSYLTMLARLSVLDCAAGPLAETATDRMIRQQAQWLQRTFPAVDFDNPDRHM